MIKTVFLSCFWMLTITVSAQDKIHKVYEDAYNPRLLPYEDIIRLIQLEDEISLKDYYAFAKDRKDVKSARVILAMGFLDVSKDTQIVSFISSVAKERKRYNYHAAKSILRIGGDPLEDYLNTLFSVDDVERQHKVLRDFWSIDNLSDLKIIEKKGREVIKNHPDWRLSKYLSKNFLIKLEVILSVLENKNSSDTKLLLEEIIEGRNRFYLDNFDSLGAHGIIWALKMLVKEFTNTPQERQSVLNYLQIQKDKVGDIPLKGIYLFYLSTLDYQFFGMEKEMLSKSRGILFDRRYFMTFQSSDELLEYYFFCKKYTSLRFRK